MNEKIKSILAYIFEWLGGLIILIILILFVSSPTVNATETFSTEEGITVTKKTIGTDGTLEFTIKDTTFDESLEYKWGISTSKDSSNVNNWYALAIGSTAKTANFNLSDNDSSIKKILYSTNIVYLYVKENATGTFLIDGLKLDLTLDPTELVNINELAYWYDIYDIYSISPNSYQFVKIENGKDVPDSGWKSMDKIYNSLGTSQINDENWITEDGTYYLWVKYVESGSKIIYGYKTVIVDDSGPTVKSIQIVSPSSGTYKTPQTVKINVYFSEKIKGSTVPTLKIKFGDSPERTLTNGTIKNTGYSTPCIEYSYNIQSTDKGQLQTVSLSGGNITDEKGNEAVLSCPLLSGSITIKANTEGTTTNNTNNQDKTNNNSSTNSSDKNNSNNVTTSNNSSTNNETSINVITTNKQDTTVASGKIPQTGVRITLIISIFIVFTICIFTYFKYNKLKGI